MKRSSSKEETWAPPAKKSRSKKALDVKKPLDEETLRLVARWKRELDDDVIVIVT